MVGLKEIYVAGSVVDWCSSIVMVVIMSAPGMARPSFIFWSKRMWWWFRLHAPASLSKVQPRFAHISEEKNMARIFGNRHLLLIIIFYPFPRLFFPSFSFKIYHACIQLTCSYISQSRQPAIDPMSNTIYIIHACHIRHFQACFCKILKALILSRNAFFCVKWSPWKKKFLVLTKQMFNFP